MEKKITQIIITLFMVSVYSIIKANPVQTIYFSEILFTNDSWIIELSRIDGIDNYNNWFLATGKDTVQFKNGIEAYGDFFVITPDDLIENLSINRNGDTLKLLNNNKSIYDSFQFGDDGYVVAPNIGQSINIIYGHSGLYYYLDNSPTIGYANDTVGAKGELKGVITDYNKTPVQDARVIYKEYWYAIEETVSDSAGHFNFIDYARKVDLIIIKDSCTKYLYSFQLYPDSSVTMDTIKLEIISSIENVDYLPITYELLQNYPNPFNPTTTINYQIPSAGHISLKVYDILGREITTLVNEERTAGKYEVKFDGTSLSSGVYFYRLQSGAFSETKKFMLLK